jgi:hypothetical protein
MQSLPCTANFTQCNQQSMQVISHNYALFLGSYMFQPTQPSAGLLCRLHRGTAVFTFVQNTLKFSDLQVNVYFVLFLCFNVLWTNVKT